MNTETEKGLVPIESRPPLEIYGPDMMEGLLKEIEGKAMALSNHDISTEKGRAEIRSAAHKVRLTKGAIDRVGIKLAEEARETVNRINAQRKQAETFLDDLVEKVRKPLTDHENKEKERIKQHEERIDLIVAAGQQILQNWQIIDPEAANERLDEIEADRLLDWQEFKERAHKEIEQAVARIGAALAQRKKHDDEQAELVRLRAEAEARKKKDDEDRIAAEAASKAKKEAEDKAAAELEKVNAEAERKRKKEEDAKLAAEKREADAKRKLKEAEDKIEEDRKKAETVKAADALKKEEQRIDYMERMIEHIQACGLGMIDGKPQPFAILLYELETKIIIDDTWLEFQERALVAREEALAKINAGIERQKKKAAEDEEKLKSQRLEDERQRRKAEADVEAAATANREADKKHRSKIDRAAVEALIAVGVADIAAIATIKAIAAGEVPNVKITY